MDYVTLYETWKREMESSELQSLDKSFYVELSEYLRNLKGEIQMLDEKTLIVRLALKEDENVKKMVKDLVQTRYRKIFMAVLEDNRIPIDDLTSGEVIINNSVLSTKEEVESIMNSILRGYIKDDIVTKRPKRILVRFLQDMPAIVGPNMKTYGPFKTEDIASLPIENAETLINRSVVVKVQVH